MKPIMKLIISTFIFIALNSQLIFCQDIKSNNTPEYPIPFIVPPPVPCNVCPEWAKRMSQYEWEDWERDNTYERDHQILMNQLAIESRSYEESKTIFKIGALGISVGALLEIIALTIELSDYDDINKNKGYISPLLFSGFILMGTGGIGLVISF